MVSGIESAKLKIARATEHLSTLNQVISSAASGDSLEIVRDADGKETVHFQGEVPPEISILAGEIVYQIRSAIDHLALELVKLNPGGITLPANWEESCCFPLWLKIPKKVPTYNCFEHILPGITRTAFAFIESVQPYHNGPGIHNVMRLIAQLSNVDKHRHLNVTIPKVAVHLSMTVKGTIEYDITVGGLKQSSQIVTEPIPEDATEVQRRFTHYVTFDEPTVGDGVATLEVQHVLEVCVEQIKTAIIPEFTKLLKNP
jgi:hypothetical protein